MKGGEDLGVQSIQDGEWVPISLGPGALDNTEDNLQLGNWIRYSRISQIKDNSKCEDKTSFG